MQAPFTQISSLKQGACGPWLIVCSGMTSRKARVNLMIHSSPSPLFMASLSSQSTSTPSKLLSSTYCPSLRPHCTGSKPRVVGNYESPKALTIILMPASLYLLRRLFCTSSVVLPKEFPHPKQLYASAHTMAISLRLPEQVQKAMAMWLYICGGEYPGTPQLVAIASPYQFLILLTQAILTGQLVLGIVNLEDQQTTDKATKVRTNIFSIIFILSRSETDYIVQKWNAVANCVSNSVNTSCSICREHLDVTCPHCTLLNDPDITCKETKGQCGHSYHKHCLDRWFSSQKKHNCLLCTATWNQV